MNDWLVNCKEGTSEQDALLARLFWQFEFDAKQKIVFAYTSKELAARYGISEPQLRKIQVTFCTVQAPDSTCRQCRVGLLWRAKSFGSRGDFQKYVDDWKTSVCNECRAAAAAKQKAAQEERERARQAEAAANKARQRQRYGDRVIGDCPRCSGVLIVRKSQTNGGLFCGCSEYPGCDYTAPIPKANKVTPEEIAEAKRLLADAPKCLKCDAPMRRISGKYGDFWGCTQYPRCTEKMSISALEPVQPEAPAPVGNNAFPTMPLPPMTFEEQERARMQAELSKPWDK